MPAAPSRRGRTARLTGLAAILVLAAVLAAWGLQARYADGAGSSKDDPAPSYSVAVRQGGTTLASYDLAALRALPQSRVVIDGKEQTGPLLATLLEDAGVGSYDAVLVKGAGLRDKGSLTLTPDQVRQRVQIDFSDRGTVKVCGPRLYHAEWVRDVLSIDAR
jgi:hypothetical protein